MKTQPIAKFLGLNNRLPDTELRIATRQLSGQYLSQAENVDFDSVGNARRRQATKLLVPVTGIHSLRMVSETTGYAVIASVLYAVTLPAYTATLLKALTTDAALSWVEYGDSLYYSNGTDSGRIAAGVWYPIGLPTPDTPATPSTISGALLAGTYQISLSYSRIVAGNTLEEGGISASVNPVLEATGGFRITLPAATPGATHINIHLSECNGEVPMLLASVPVGTATYDAVARATGHEAQIRYEDELPAGFLFLSNGRLCSASGSTVYVGLPHRPGYYLPAEGYIPFPDTVALAVENQGGTYICTGSATYWFPGDLGDVQGQIGNPLPFGAVPGSVFTHPTKPLVGWFSTSGVVLGDIGGQLDPLTIDNVDVTVPASGISVVVEEDGYRRVVSCGYCVNLETSAASTYTGWDFTSAASGYGTKPDGVYLLKSAGLVDSIMNFGKVDFGSEELKHLPTVYAGVASDTPMEITVAYSDERDAMQEYSFQTRASSTNMQQQRFDTAKGMRANWFELTLRNTDGGDFTLASVSFAPTVSTRRI